MRQMLGCKIPLIILQITTFRFQYKLGNYYLFTFFRLDLIQSLIQQH